MSLYIPKGFSVEQKNDYLTIDFPQDSNQKLYVKKEVAQKIDVINLSFRYSMQESNTNTFKCNEISREIFTILFRIAVENKNIQESLTVEMRQNPFIYEDLTGYLAFYYPCSFEKTSKLALKEFFGMTLEDAEAMIKRKTDSLTIGLVLAEKKVRQSIYFETRIEAENYFSNMNEYIQAYCTAKNSSDQNELKQIKETIESLKRDFKKLKESPRGKQNAAQFVNDPNPLIRFEALKAVEILNDYCQTIRKGLDSCDSDMSNTQVLEHLIGPKNYLLSDNGIVYLENAFKSKKPFRYVPVLQSTCIAKKRPHYAPNLTFSLKISLNQDSQEIENHIKKFISECNSLDKRLIDKFSNRLSSHRNNSRVCPKTIHPEIAVFENDEQEELVARLKPQNEKNQIYFSSAEEAEKWFEANQHPKEFKHYKQTIWAQHHASQHLDSENPKIFLAALKATKIIANYRKKTIKALQACDADLSQEKLLEYLIGPKNYLFAYYGLTRTHNLEDKRPFYFTPGTKGTYETDEGCHLSVGTSGCTYELNNRSPKALEEEIRSDITSTINYNNKQYLLTEIPPHLIEDDEVCYIESFSLKNLKNEIGPKLFEWSKLEPEDKKIIYQKLLEYNEWTQFDFNGDQLELDVPEGIVPESISGTINYRGQSFAISFNTMTYLLTITENFTNPNKSSSHLFLKSLTALNSGHREILILENHGAPIFERREPINREHNSDASLKSSQSSYNW